MRLSWHLFSLFLVAAFAIMGCKSHKNGQSVSASADHNRSEVQQASKTMPELTLRDVKGNILTSADLKGKKVFINLWATWCPPCVAEMPSIQTLFQGTNNPNAAFVLISLDDRFETAKKFASKKGYEMPIYEVVGNLPDLFNVPGIPATFVFDESGKLSFTHVGMTDYSKKRFVQMMQP